MVRGSVRGDNGQDFGYFEKADMSPNLLISCFPLSLALLLSTFCSGPKQARLSNTKAGTPLMGCLWMMIRTARCVWLRARLSLQPDWMLTSWGGNTAGFTEGLTGLSTLYKGLTLWKCSIQYLGNRSNHTEVRR